MAEIIECRSENDFTIGKQIAADYLEWLAMDLSFQQLDSEFDNFSTVYARPAGAFFCASCEGELAGCAGIRRLSDTCCEMKRLFVYPHFSGRGIGRLLCTRLIQVAGELGYRHMRLDTIARLDRALALYRKLGFYQIEQYRENPDPTAIFMQLDIDAMSVKVRDSNICVENT